MQKSELHLHQRYCMVPLGVLLYDSMQTRSNHQPHALLRAASL